MRYTRVAVLVGLVTLTWLGPQPQTNANEAFLPAISQTNVFRQDPVEAAKGRMVDGTVLSAHREGDVVHYCVSDENCALYAKNSAAYPDAGKPVRLAFMGADPVLRFPNGVHDPALGPVIDGDPDRFVISYKGAPYTFAYEATMIAFKSAPERYIPPVGAYCLGAMSMDHVTPGDPRNVFFVPEIGKTGMWAVFGSPNGPIAWAKMKPDERRQHYQAAVSNYQRRTGTAPTGRDKIAAVH